MFDHVTPGREAARGLMRLVQGDMRVSDYSIDFRKLAAESDWNEPALWSAFHHGLSGSIKDELAARDPPTGLDDLIATAIRIDGRLQERRRERAQGAPPRRFPGPSSLPPASRLFQRNSASSDPGEPMQLGRAGLSVSERQRRRRDNCCLYCGKEGHYVASCPVKDGAHQNTGGRW